MKGEPQLAKTRSVQIGMPKKDEEEMVAGADAVVDPVAMMVEARNAALTHVAVLCSRFPHLFAVRAKLLCPMFLHQLDEAGLAPLLVGNLSSGVGQPGPHEEDSR
eukprot:CAMPEP_0202966192 /NCGR_PEP_ID=MMETSP1396-20130829/10484_1 /ASSEMBLY_ACC=CAM_ASM_000872 /TAXON_ID= /ORGANISM="Pseudokeronopsis sp., Strain Brazil" /LENGTH=104 /DNA_ID=CAMNT_0049689743 /DNA_START=402 /DNA_END=717 /DNA_ORIENTATION=-